MSVLEKRNCPGPLCLLTNLEPALTAEYQCLFGISNPQADLTVGTTEDTIAQDVSVTVSVSPGGRVFWFLFGRMPQTYQYKEIPRFSNNNATDFATRHGDLMVCPDAGITISDLVASREMMVLVPLEEGVFKTWTANRITCLGDSVSKMTPHTGTGGMLAMEAAAALANTLVSLSEQNSIPNLADLAPALQLWETRLKSRAAVAVELSGNAARIQALKSWPHRAFVKYILRHVGDARADEICDTAVGAERIQYLPLPLRSLEGNMPFNPEHGIARHESKLRRFFVAICAMLLGLVTYCVLGQIGERVPNYSLGPYDTFRSLVQSYQELKMLFKCPLLANYVVWYIAMMIESSRRSHNLNAVRWYVPLVASFSGTCSLTDQFSTLELPELLETLLLHTTLLLYSLRFVSNRSLRCVRPTAYNTGVYENTLANCNHCFWSARMECFSFPRQCLGQPHFHPGLLHPPPPDGAMHAPRNTPSRPTAECT